MKNPMRKGLSSVLAVLLASSNSASLWAQNDARTRETSGGIVPIAGNITWTLHSADAAKLDFSDGPRLDPVVSANLGIINPLAVDSGLLRSAETSESLSVNANRGIPAEIQKKSAIELWSTIEAQATEKTPIGDGKLQYSNQTERSVDAKAITGDAPSARKPVFSSLFRAALNKVAGKLFDAGAVGRDVSVIPTSLAFASGLGIVQPHIQRREPKLPNGVTLDRAPKTPKEVGKLADSVRAHFNSDQASPGRLRGIMLNADPTNLDSVERALRALVDSDPEKYGASAKRGTPSDDMFKASLTADPGLGDQADGILVTFRQLKKGRDLDGSDYYLAVDGASLRFHIKVLDGKPELMLTEGGFAGDIDPAIMEPKFADDELKQKAAARLRLPAKKLSRLTRFITTMDDRAWHAVDVYQADDLRGQPVIVAVDVQTGQAWAFGSQDFRYRDFLPRRGPSSWLQKTAGLFKRTVGLVNRVIGPQRSAIRLTVDSPAQGGRGGVTGIAEGRGTTLTSSGEDHGPTAPKPLATGYVSDDQGHVLATIDSQGSFTIPADGRDGGPIPIVVRLRGVYGEVTDADSSNQPVEARLSVLPGQTVRVTLNPTGDDEELTADVNVFVYSSELFQWIKSFLGLKDPRLFTPLAGGFHANDTSMPGNAFYSPEVDGFFTMKRATVKLPGGNGNLRTVTFENTAPPHIIFRELARRAALMSLHSVTFKNTSQPAGIFHKFAEWAAGYVRSLIVTFENTGQPSIIFHELTHRLVQMVSQILLTVEQLNDKAYRFVVKLMDPIMAAGVNEALADKVSMFIRNSPELGNGFVINPPPGMPTDIRNGRNVTTYDPNNPDPHAVGAPLMETAWDTWEDIILLMGAEAGSRYAAKLFVTTLLFIQPGNVASALTHAMVASITKDGRLGPAADMIRKNAQKRLIDLPPAPNGPAS